MKNIYTFNFGTFLPPYGYFGVPVGANDGVVVRLQHRTGNQTDVKEIKVAPQKKREHDSTQKLVVSVNATYQSANDQ